MIVLDTDVISEIMAGPATSPVLPWLRAQSHDDLRIPAVAAMEITFGISRLPEGRRREDLATAWSAVVDAWSSAFLSIDVDTARLAGEIQGLRRQVGRPLHLADSLVAASALRHTATLATRNVKDFQGLGLTVVNPWQTGQQPGQ